MNCTAHRISRRSLGAGLALLAALSAPLAALAEPVVKDGGLPMPLIERFESLTTTGKFLSLSFWRDEEAVRAWRNLPDHRAAQGRGRAGVFADYRLRVATVIRDYGLAAREQAPADSRGAHD